MAREESIRVCIRQRPLFQKEKDAGHQIAWTLSESGSLRLNFQPPAGQRIKTDYVFDSCFDSDASNEKVFDKTAKDLVLDITDGYNGCYMAYGQTGCGKTFSIMGCAADPGMLPRTVALLFDYIDTYQKAANVVEVQHILRVDYVEIYNEKVNDLFQAGAKGKISCAENLDVKEDKNGSFYVQGLRQVEVGNLDDVMELLQVAETRRHFACTNFNETSSRSHTVFSAILETKKIYDDGAEETVEGEMKLVDLAGNERAAMAAEGVEDAKERQAEGQAINKSLFVLAEVISKLSKKSVMMAKGEIDKKQMAALFIPWRDSKLTRIVQKALGGNSRACLLVAVHPSTQSLEISLSTLRFAERSKKISKKIQKNFMSPEQSLIASQRELIAKLQAQLAYLTEKTGIEIPAEISAGAAELGAMGGLGGGAGMGGVEPAVAKAMEEQAKKKLLEVSKLKQDLRARIDKLSAMIFTAKPAAGVAGAAAGAGALTFFRTSSMPTKRRAKVDDLPARLRDSPEGKSLQRAMSILHRIQLLSGLRMGDSVTADEGEEAPEAYETSLGRLDTFVADDLTVMATGGVARAISFSRDTVADEAVSALRRQRRFFYEENQKLKQTVKDINCKTEYLQSVFRMLGLSPLLTQTTAVRGPDNKMLPVLEDLSAFPGDGSAGGLAAAIVSASMPAGGRATETPLNHALPLTLRIDQVHARLLKVRGQDSGDLSYSGMVKSEASVDAQRWKELLRNSILELVNSRLIYRYAPFQRGLVPNSLRGLQVGGDVVSRQDRRTEELKKLQIDKKIDTILGILNPSEKLMLILGQDQHSLRSEIQELKSSIDNKMSVVNKYVKYMTLEKFAWAYHCRKVVKAIQWYANSVAHESSIDGNETFSHLMTEMEDLSRRLIERDVEISMARDYCLEREEENRELKKQLDRLHRYTRCLDPDNNALLISDAELHGLAKEEDRTNLLGQILLHRQLYLEQECRRSELELLVDDVSTINRELSADLNKVRLQSVEHQQQETFYKFQLDKERQHFKTQIHQTTTLLDNHVDRVAKLEQKALRLEEQLAQKELELNQALKKKATKKTREEDDADEEQLLAPPPQGSSGSEKKPSSRRGSKTPTSKRRPSTSVAAKPGTATTTAKPRRPSTSSTKKP